MTNGRFTDTYHHYYLVESRSYLRGDKALCGAYNWLSDFLAEKVCYARGLVVWYRNEGIPDNNTYFHPGQGDILPVDVHPATMLTPDGKNEWAGRWQAWDAPLSPDRQRLTLTQPGVGQKTYTAEPVTTFADSSTTAYWDPKLPYNSVRTAGSGVKLSIASASKDRSTYTVKLSSSQAR